MLQCTGMLKSVVIQSEMTDVQVYVGTAAIGAVAGMRAMSAPAMITHVAKAGLLSVGERQLELLSSPRAVYPTLVLAIGELIADKLPFMPKRTAVPSLIGRAITGGLSGAALASAKRRSRLIGAVIGAAAAVGAAYGAYHLRRQTVRKLKIPDPVVAVIEDALVVGCGMLVLSKLGSQTTT